jgi:hypothetical protein
MATRSILYRGYFRATHGQIIVNPSARLGHRRTIGCSRHRLLAWFAYLDALHFGDMEGPEYGLQQITRSRRRVPDGMRESRYHEYKRYFICLRAVAALGFESSFELSRTFPVCSGPVGLWAIPILLANSYLPAGLWEIRNSSRSFTRNPENRQHQPRGICYIRYLRKSMVPTVAKVELTEKLEHPIFPRPGQQLDFVDGTQPCQEITDHSCDYFTCAMDSPANV